MCQKNQEAIKLEIDELLFRRACALFLPTKSRQMPTYSESASFEQSKIQKLTLKDKTNGSSSKDTKIEKKHISYTPPELYESEPSNFLST